MVIGITGTNGSGEKVWDTFARPGHIFYETYVEVKYGQGVLFL